MKNIVILAIVCLVTASLSGCLTTVFGEPEPPADGEEIDVSEISDILSAISIDEIKGIVVAADELNVKIYGVNVHCCIGARITETIDEYTRSHADWTLRFNSNGKGFGWNSYARAWSKTVYVHAVIVIDGELVKLGNYDFIVITSHAYYTTYQKYFDW